VKIVASLIVVFRGSAVADVHDGRRPLANLTG